MAQRTIDDLDDQSPASTRNIIIDGYSIFIDLSEENYTALAEALAPYFKAGRARKGHCPHPALAPITEITEGPAFGSPGSTAPPTVKEVMAGVAADNKTIRDWWRKNETKRSLDLPMFNVKGVIPASVRDAFDKAHQPT